MSDLPKSYKTSAGEEITMSTSGIRSYLVECWDANGESRWYKYFYSLELAEAEYDRFKHLEAK